MALFGGDDVDRRIQEVRQQWKSVIEGSAVRCRECGSIFSTQGELENHMLSRHGEKLSKEESQTGAVDQHWIEAVQMSPRRMAAYMLGGFLLLILFAVFGIVNLWLAPLTGIVGYFLVRKGRQGNPPAILLGILFLAHPSLLILSAIGLNFAALAAILGLLGFVLAGIEDSAKRQLGPYGEMLFHVLSALFIPMWFLSLANVLLSILATDFLNLGFGAMVVASVGTSAYLFASGNIADGIGVYRGIGAGIISLYDRLVVGYELSGEQNAEVGTVLVLSTVSLFYGIILVADPSAFLALPFVGGLLGQNPLFPFIIGMMGPLAFYHFLTRAEDIMRAGGQAGRAAVDRIPGGGGGPGAMGPDYPSAADVRQEHIAGKVVGKSMRGDTYELTVASADGRAFEVLVYAGTYEDARAAGRVALEVEYNAKATQPGPVTINGQDYRELVKAREVR